MKRVARAKASQSLFEVHSGDQIMHAIETMLAPG